MFLYSVLLAPRQFTLSLESLALFVVCLGGSLLYAGAMWFLFERNTDAVRAFIETRLGLRAAVAGVGGTRRLSARHGGDARESIESP